MNLIPLPTATIDDDDVAVLLRRALVVINPIVRLVATDPLGLKQRTHALWASDAAPAKVLDGLAWILDAADVPGTNGWSQLSIDERVDWWVHRVGAVDTLLVAFPGALGAIADRLPIQDALGFVNQAVILCALARELGVTDVDEQVQLIGAVLCQRDLTDDVTTDDTDDSAEGRTAAETAWHLVGVARAIERELGKRPQPRAVFRFFGMLPGVGAVADYLGEYGAMVRATNAGRRWLAVNAARADG